MSTRAPRSMPAGRVRGITFRFLAFLALWMLMVGGDRADFAPGVVAAAVAAWVSVILRPAHAAPTRMHPLLMLGLLFRFVWTSVLAGLDIARRAFSPALPLNPGILVYATRLPEGLPLNLFKAIASLMPGTLCTGIDDSGRLIFHCLDVAQPVVQELAGEEARILAALGVDPVSRPGRDGDGPGGVSDA